MNLSELLEPIASQFRSLGIPEPIVHWGHPVMMGIVVLAMGSAVAYTGWRGRIAGDKEVSQKNRSSHRQIAPWMFTFMALGYTGGLLSLVMQRQPILESPHFWTGTVLLVILAINGVIAFTGFGGNKDSLRIAHAYLGTVAIGMMLIHGILGLKLGLSI